MSDLIDRQMLKADLLCGDNTEHDYCLPCKKILERIDNQPSAQPRLNKKRISDLLWNEYRTMSPHLSAEGVVARRYYCKELWKELFGEEEMPVWMTW